MPAGRALAWMAPTSQRTHSGALKPRITTPWPRWTPRAMRARATRRVCSRYSFQLVTCHAPSRLTRIAGRCPWRAATSSRASGMVRRRVTGVAADDRPILGWLDVVRYAAVPRWSLFPSTSRGRGTRARSETMKLVENTVVAGRFRLNHVLGGGGMGAVWHATHLGLDIPCAIKFVKGELADNEDMRARFEREAKAAAHLRSPHVVQILDHGVCEGTPYIAMELLDGEDLGARLQKVGRLSPEEVYKVMSEACRALTKAHANGIVHRDLKPDNIFMVRDDEREITKVLDFGIAKSVTNELGGSGTKTGAMLGTPYYMSPEQAQGTKAVDFRSDLWSLAVITFQCLTGSLPFESEALGDLLVKIIISPIPIPSQIAPVPTGFDKWWAKAASREVSERFQSAKEFSDGLAPVCGISHVSGVIDRPQLRVVSETEQGAGGTGPRQLITPPVAGGRAAGEPVPTPATFADPQGNSPAVPAGTM